MHPLVQRISVLMPPPTEPPAEKPPWDQVPEQTGFRLPQDYRDFVDLYGDGEINDHLGVIGPTLRPPRPDLPPGLRGFTEFLISEIADVFAKMREADPEGHPYPVYPEAGGLLPWGRTSSSDHFFWLTEDENPDRWPVVIWFRHARFREEWQLFDGGMAAFLLSLLDGTSPHTHLLPDESPHWERHEDWSRSYT